jgi:hypothetical protein
MSFLPDAPSGTRSPRAAGPVTGGPVHVDQLQCDCRRHPPPSQSRLRTAVHCSCRLRSRPTLVRLSKRSAAASGRAFREPSCFRPRQPSTAADRCASVHVAPKMPRSAFSATVPESLTYRLKSSPWLREVRSLIHRHLDTLPRGPSHAERDRRSDRGAGQTLPAAKAAL